MTIKYLDLEGLKEVFSVVDGKIDTAKQDVLQTVDSKIEQEVNKVVGGAPETYDTLKEIADYIEDHKDVEATLNAAIGEKANKADVYTRQETDKKILDAVTDGIDLSEYAKTADFVAITNEEIDSAAATE